MVRYQDYRNVLFLIQTGNGIHYLLAAPGVQHRRWFIQNDAPGFHGDHTCNGNSLLLAAGKKMRRMLAVGVHIHLLQCLIHPISNFRTGNSKIFRAKCHILFYHIGNDLIVGVLKYHSHIPANRHDPLLVGGIDSAHINLAPAGKQNRVEMLCQSGLSAAIGPKNCHKAALFYFQIQIRENRYTGCVLNPGIGIGKMFY